MVLRQAKFLKAFAGDGVVVTAAAAAGVRPRQVYRWVQNDPTFKQLYDECFREAIDQTLAEVVRRGQKGWLEPVYQGGQRVGVIRKYSDNCLLSLAKARLDGFKDRREITGKGGQPLFGDPHQMSDAELRVPFELAAKALGYVIVAKPELPAADEIDEKGVR